MPEKTGFPGFDRDENGLWPLHVGVAAGFVFASLAADPEPLGTTSARSRSGSRPIAPSGS